MTLIKENKEGSPFYINIDRKDQRTVRVFRALLVRQGISEDEFWMPIINDYLAQHSRIVERSDLVGPKDLLRVVKEEFDLDLRREDIYGFRNRSWKKGRDYFEVMSGKKKTFTYDLKKLRPYFQKLAERRQRKSDKQDEAERVTVVRKLGNSTVNPLKVMGYDTQAEEAGDNR